MKSKLALTCSCGCNRREFITRSGIATLGISALPLVNLFGSPMEVPTMLSNPGAKVRTLFIYPPSKSMADDPDGWWSWPGTEFDAEGHQKLFTSELQAISSKLNMRIDVDRTAIPDEQGMQQVISELKSDPVDGLLLVLFHNWSLPLADTLLKNAEDLGIPSVFYIELGVKHGSIQQYKRPGIYFIQAKKDFEAIESGMRMINARKVLKQSALLSITEQKGRKQSVEPFLGITVKPVLFDEYAEGFHSVAINQEAKDFINGISNKASDINKVSREAMENATRAYFALRQLLEEHQANAVTMNCLRRGMLKPCIGFSMLNSQLIPAICENDMNAAYGQMLVQAVCGQPGFQHNPAFNTEENRYYASHCTCPTKLQGPDGEDMSYRLTRFLHTNEGSCAIQVFWKPDDPVTMVHYYSGKEPKLDVYSGKVFKSHQELVGCATNVEISITDREEASSVQGHHNMLLLGDLSKVFRDFAQLHKIQLVKA